MAVVETDIEGCLGLGRDDVARFIADIDAGDLDIAGLEVRTAVVEARLGGRGRSFESEDPAESYGLALLALIRAAA